MLKRYKFPLLLFGLPLISNIIIFLWVYSFGGDIALPIQIPFYVIISILPWLIIKRPIGEKIIFTIITFLVNCFLNYVLIFSAMFLPGSKEHNHIMYDICLPKMREVYGITKNQPFPSTQGVDKRGFAKWWYQHSECEQNVRKGLGVVWSENPSGFVPVNFVELNTKNWKTYIKTYNHYHYSFSYPNNWQITECGGGEVVVSKTLVNKCMLPLEAPEEYLNNVYLQVFMPGERYASITYR